MKLRRAEGDDTFGHEPYRRHIVRPDRRRNITNIVPDTSFTQQICTKYKDYTCI